MSIKPLSPLVCLEYIPTDSSILAGGCYNGQIGEPHMYHLVSNSVAAISLVWQFIDKCFFTDKRCILWALKA